jgi:lipid II:glycine glycyltransferase (peptidoglycan interpeptide bridge formation enzyme)
MITIKKKQFLFTLTENWFEYKFKWSDLFLPVSYRGLRPSDQKFHFGIKKYTKTVVLPLENSIEEIHSKFSSSHKRYIKKAGSEGVTCNVNSDRKKFILFYNDFAKSKGLNILDIDRSDEYGGDIWKASYAVLDGQILAVHSYLEDQESGIVRLMESGSLRLNNNYDPGKIAQANKLLHDFDIKYFKERGLKYYDFGGWDDIQSLLEFKEAFGAYPISIFNYFTYTFVFKEKLKEIAAALKKTINFAKK